MRRFNGRAALCKFAVCLSFCQISCAPQGKTSSLTEEEPSGCEPDGSTLPSYDLQLPRRVGDLEGHTGMVSSLAFNKVYQDLLLSTSHDGSLRLWNVREQRELWKADYPRTKLVHGAFSNDGQYVAAVGQMAHIDLYDVFNGELLVKYELPDADVWGDQTLFSADSRYVIVGASDGVVYVFERDTGVLRSEFWGHDAPVRHLAYSPERNLVASSSGTGVLVWNLETGNQVAELLDDRVATGETFWVESISFAPKLDYVVVGSRRMAALFETQTGRIVQRFVGHTRSIMSADLSPDYCQVVSASQDGFVQIFDVRSGQALSYAMGWGIIPSPRFVTTTATAPNTRSFAIAKWLFNVTEIEIWDIPQNDRIGDH